MVTSEAAYISPPDPDTQRAFGPQLVTLLIGGPDQNWLFPDDPFLNNGCRVLRATSLDDAWRIFHEQAPALVFLPLQLAETPSVPCVKTCLEGAPDTTIVVVANNQQINDAAEAMRLGAFDCLFLPFSADLLAKTVAGAAKCAARKLNQPLPARPAAGPSAAGPSAAGLSTPLPGDQTGQFGLVGSHPATQQLLRSIRAYANSQAPVFIQGEHGTGKEALARALHAAASQASGGFLRVDCASLDPARLDDLFADTPTAGQTLFLDEIANLTHPTQSRLLHHLHDDGPVPMRPDLRLVCATSHDPDDEMRRANLRKDLFYRLHVAPLTVPPLRARGNDVVEIAEAKLRLLAASEGRQFQRLTDAAALALLRYHWPGNVRQLLNVIWNVVLEHDGVALADWMLPDTIRVMGPAADNSSHADMIQIAGRTLAQIERDVIEQVLRDTGGSIPRAARVLDVSPSTLYRKRQAWEPDSNS